MGSWVDYTGQNIEADFTGKNKPKLPDELPAPPEAKGIDSAEVQAARKSTLLTESLGQTRKSTFITGARGLQTKPGTKKTLGE